MAIPQAIGPYAVSEAVSAGAFTVTYRATSAALGRAVLLRTLKPTVSASSPFAAAIAREGRVLARLDHEGILRLHDLVTPAEGAPYLVLEDPGATPLEEILRLARPEPDVAAAVALAAARALAHTHERGIVHRALSTAVLAIAPRGRVLVTDFSAAGLCPQAPGAARAEADRDGLPSLPEPIEAGDPCADTLAPEQILGEEADRATDVWALGAVLHELLAGARPFSAGDARAVAQRIRTAPPAPLPPGVPEALARVVARCLAKDRADRFPDAIALAAALEDALPAITLLTVPVLASRALAAAGRGEALPAREGAGARPPRVHGPPAPVALARVARDLTAVLALIVAGGAGVRILADPDAAEGEGVPEAAPPGAGNRDQGLVRVVARPWAEVYVDGELADVTPVGRPLAVAPGRHFITFRHPSAPDEQRAIKIAAGQSVFLDVTMRVDRGDAGPGRDAGVDPESP